ncbi:glutaredoxin family protein [Peribacillus simplex]|uniref:Glutaredoxin family protein n=1 Tax=Peribacillus simplex TaxID=1478 RepID=A0AAW7I8C5_9BACI|nr:glutaredoxin family protein [Peribacillus simplex]MDM5451474.1 glutaredoxin family protein [Peribacillus simplex]
MESNAFVLYSREKCPLCDKAKRILEEVKFESGIGYKEIDIHTDDDLVEKFGLMIPVVEWKDDIVQFGNVDKLALNRLFEK